MRSDERNAFIELTGCAKEIFSILYEKNNLNLLEIKEALSHTYDEREIIRELSQLEQMVSARILFVFRYQKGPGEIPVWYQSQIDVVVG